MKQILVGAVAIAALGALMALSSQDNRDALSTAWQRWNDDPGLACFDYEKPSLKDPHSAKLESYVDKGSDGVRIVYHAKNSYGAYGRGEALCYVDRGKVNTDQTQTLRRLEELNQSRKLIEVEIACLDERNDLLKMGTSFDIAEKKKIDCVSKGQ